MNKIVKLIYSKKEERVYVDWKQEPNIEYKYELYTLDGKLVATYNSGGGLDNLGDARGLENIEDSNEII